MQKINDEALDNVFVIILTKFHEDWWGLSMENRIAQKHVNR